MTEWIKYKLGNIVKDIAMGPFGSNLKVDNFISQGVPVIRGSNLNHYAFTDSKFVYVSEEKAMSLKRSLAYPDDLVFTHRGTIGQVGIIPKNKYPYYLVSQSQMRLTVDLQFVNPRFLYYFFLSPLGKKELLRNSSQVGVPAIANPTRSLKEVNIHLPPLEVQSKAANILSSLDDKIELNLQMNKTLESIAQAIFKEWFVGEKNTSLSQYIDFNPKVSIPKGRLTKYVEMSDLPVSGFSIRTEVSRNYSNGSKFENNDTLLARITPCLENGKTGFVDFLETNEYACGSTEFIVMRAKERISPYYVYLVARDNNFREFAIKSMVGTSGRQRVQTDLLRSFLVPAIDIVKMDEFKNIVTPLFNRIKLNSDAILILSSMRDLLIPKLMTGKIRVA